MKHVVVMGMVWQMSDKNFMRLAKELKASGTVKDMEVYGRVCIGKLYQLGEVMEKYDEDSTDARG